MAVEDGECHYTIVKKIASLIMYHFSCSFQDFPLIHLHFFYEKKEVNNPPYVLSLF